VGWGYQELLSECGGSVVLVVKWWVWLCGRIFVGVGGGVSRYLGVVVGM